MSEERLIVSDGAAEDMIRAFVQIGCAEIHAKTILEKAEAEMEEGIIDLEDSDAVERQMKKISDIEEEMNDLANLRRRTMLRLFDMYAGDKDYWCMAKHVGTGAYTLFEAYEATGDPTLYDLALEANKAFIRTLTHFLGVEVTSCAACFADLLKAKGDK